MMKVFYYVLLFFLSFALFLGIFFTVNLIPTETTEYEPIIVGGKSNGVITNTSQFYPNMRYPRSTITYNISSNCDQNRQSATIEGFQLISDQSILKFTRLFGPAEIEIVCSQLSETSEINDHFIAGEGGPKDIINTGAYYVILSGKIALYRDERCDSPKIAVHEILHALGFDHNNDKMSILYPVTSCDEVLDDYIIDELNSLYSVESLPDLSIIKADAEKSGRYLNFKVEIMNQGLKTTENSKLSVFANDNFVKEFELGNINIGIKKIIDVQNLKVPSNTAHIEFEVSSDEVADLDRDNNIVLLDIVD